MSKPKTHLYRRHRQQKTDYKKRLHLLLSGKPRLVIRLTNTQVIGQITSFTTQGDKILLGLSSKELVKLGWNFSSKNIPAAYLTGVLLGKTALSKGYKEAIFDTGSRRPQPNGRIYAFLKGMLDAGFQVPHGDNVAFPNTEKISGSHIQTYANHLKDQPAYQQRFARYLKSNNPPEKINEQFETVKTKIMEKS
jgi:large subunit ribosomal protein L18